MGINVLVRQCVQDSLVKAARLGFLPNPISWDLLLIIVVEIDILKLLLQFIALKSLLLKFILLKLLLMLILLKLSLKV